MTENGTCNTFCRIKKEILPTIFFENIIVTRLKMTENTTSIVDGEQHPGVGFYVYYYGIFVIIGCINIPGNILVILTVLRHSVLRQPCNYYIVSLAATDLLIGFVYPLYNISHLTEVPAISVPLGDWNVCRVIVTEVLALEICSSYHLVAITVNRYIAILYPLRYHIYVTHKSTNITIASIWILSQGVCIGMYTAYHPSHEFKICRYELIFSVTHVVVLFAIQLFIPLLIMLGLYIKIARVARKQAKIIALQESGVWCKNPKSSNVLRKELKSTVMVSILLGCFAMSWTPMIIYFFITLTCDDCVISPYIRASCRILLFMNSAGNVFIYAGRLSIFRKSMKEDVRTCFRKICRMENNESKNNQSENKGTLKPSRTEISNLSQLDCVNDSPL